MEKALEILKACRDRGQKRAGGLDLDEAISELEEAMKPKTCELKQCDTGYDTHWDGSCGIGWMLAEGTPSYNGMKFCPQCGGKLIHIETKENE